MSLAEKNAISSVESQFDAYVDRIAAACGAKVKISVDWATYEGASVDAHEKTIPAGMENLTSALEFVSENAIGKEELGKTLKSVTLKYVKADSDSAVDLKDGALVYSGQWDGPCFTVGDIQAKVEEAL
jgi:hypothetical protein